MAQDQCEPLYDQILNHIKTNGADLGTRYVLLALVDAVGMQVIIDRLAQVASGKQTPATESRSGWGY